jgi:hypothetical protein
LCVIEEAGTTTGGRWTPDRARAWYARLDWPVGFNFMPSTAVNFLAMWHGPSFDAETIDRELGWAAAAGFNSLRTNLAFTIWQHDRQGLLDRLDRVLDIAAGHGLSTILCLFDDCGFSGVEPDFARQARPVPGLHNSRASASPGRAAVMDTSRRGELEAYVSDIIASHRHDDRVLVWDLYNEPGNRDIFQAGGKRQADVALEEGAASLMRDSFAWARRAAPMQPLTVAAWRLPPGEVPAAPVYRHAIDQAALALSDVVSFHAYRPLAAMTAVIDDLSRLGRPLLLTEWMARPLGSRIVDLLPLLAEERIGAWQWGLVRGLSQTHIPWPWLVEAGRDYDGAGAEWFHDLLRPDGEPFSHLELQTIATAVRTAPKGQS